MVRIAEVLNEEISEAEAIPVEAARLVDEEGNDIQNITPGARLAHGFRP